MRIISVDKKIVGYVEDHLDYYVENNGGYLLLDQFWFPKNKLDQKVDYVILDNETFRQLKNDIDQGNYYIAHDQLKMTNDYKVNEVRKIRDDLLKESDTLSMALYSDVWEGMPDQYKYVWIEYRNSLRDFPDNFDKRKEIDQIEWPEKPLSYNQYINQ